ncbi:MAG: FAD-dependent oxidoreductase [Phycisphaerae bacterium]|nr:FAD-dependent oxidoreductase [Phycisphaerae bacterium]
MAEKFDVAVIGSGPGGYAAAIRCAQKGGTIAIIEKEQIGGTCLNRGCIPSKALLASAHILTIAKNASLMGVEIENPKVNWNKMQTRKDAIVAGSGKGLAGLIQSNKIKIFQGQGFVTAKNKIAVEGSNPAQIEAKKIIIATGSVPIEIPAVAFDGKNIISSTEALNLSHIPKSMIIIGGGVIGCEMACIYATVGSKVTIIEAMPNILPFEDEWVGQLLTRELKKIGIDVITGKKAAACEKSDSNVKLSLEDGQTIEAEKVLVSIGRKAFCDSRTIKTLSLEMNPVRDNKSDRPDSESTEAASKAVVSNGMNGSAIKVNEKMQTSAADVYAIGDVVGTTYLAHGAFLEAEVAAENAMGGNACIKDYSLVPRAVYTFPEVASVGKNETRCKQMGIDYTIGRAFFKANGRSLAHNETTGEARVVRDKKTNEIIGITMVGAAVTEMIACARALLGNKEPICEISFAHPTVSEVLKEAWEDAFGISLHTPPKR